LQLLAREGSAAPGTATTFSSLELSAAAKYFNAAGQAAFAALLSDGGNGVWTGAPGGLQLLARDGQAAPGTTATFTSVTGLRSLNGNGSVAFTGGLTGAGVTSGNDTGVWVGSLGSLQLLAREGSNAPGTPADFASPSQSLLNNAGTV